MNEESECRKFGDLSREEKEDFVLSAIALKMAEGIASEHEVTSAKV